MPETEILTYLEMTSPDQLRPARPVPTLALEPANGDADLVKSTQHRIGAPYRWPSLSWSDLQWATWLAHPHRQQWIVRHHPGDQPGTHPAVAGLVEVEAQPGGEVEITTFGLVPEFVGRGFGGHALTLATRLAWSSAPIAAAAITRVWLHTSSFDHPNALANYRSRGFRPFRAESR